ncbi:MAG: hypothetical protein U1F16_09450 [Turneriella sp.]
MRRNEDDDLTRHQSELIALTQNAKRENAAMSRALAIIARLPAVNLTATPMNMPSTNCWAEFLFPAYIEVHRDLMRYFRQRKDYGRLTDELVFLRSVRATGNTGR